MAEKGLEGLQGSCKMQYQNLLEEWKLGNPPKIINGTPAFIREYEIVNGFVFLFVLFDFKLNTTPKVLIVDTTVDEAQIKEAIKEINERTTDVLNNIPQ